MSATTVALSLTGSGHLLVYQLGVCRVLLQSSLKIKHVAGSSGGAIVATLMAKNLDVEEYTDDFIGKKGRGLSLLKDRLHTVDYLTTKNSTLSVCTTRCSDGELELFDFGPIGVDEDDRTYCSEDDLLVPALEASCRIPLSFHPWDIAASSRTYEPDEGILIRNESYVDGGIAAPAPPTPSTMKRILISPITGPSPTNDDWRISPVSTSRFWPSRQLNYDFGVDASMGNLRAFRAASGMTSPSEMKEWYQLGQDDAARFLDETEH